MTARLFVALDLPGAVVEALVAWREPVVCERADLRAVAPESLHVTLCFLGARREDAIGPLAEIVSGSVNGTGGVAGLALREPLWLPQRRPRVLAVALEDRHGQLGALQDRVVSRLAADGWHAPETRPYLPHVTVARVRRGQAPPRSSDALPAVPALAFDGAALTLYRSHLHPSGARYEPLSVNRLA